MQERKTYIRKRAGKEDLYLFSTEIDSAVDVTTGVKLKSENWFITSEPNVGWIMRIESKKSSQTF